MAFTHLPLRRSFTVGAITYVVGYAITFVSTLSTSRDISQMTVSGRQADPAPLGEILTGVLPHWVVSGWIYYNAHLVPTSLPTADAINGLAYLTNQNILSTLGTVYFVLYLVPPLLLIGAGYIVARTGSTPGVNGERNAGASIAVGYFVLFLVGAFVFTSNAPDAPVSASPNGIRTVFLGLVYTLLFGALGGILADKLHSEPQSI